MGKRVISFSLWCRETQLNPHHINQHKDVYTTGAIQNTVLAKVFYPDWICRFYIDKSVPKDIVDRLVENGAEIIYMDDSNIPGMFWRFLVADDKEVDIAIIRDTDSRLNERDKDITQVFIDSDKRLHIIRDHPHHKYTILGGMWGIKVKDTKLNIRHNIGIFLKMLNRPFKRMDDMNFLEILVKKIPDELLCHDNYYYHKYYNSVPFPDYNRSNEYYHYIGEYYDQYEGNPYYERDLRAISEYKFK